MKPGVGFKGALDVMHQRACLLRTGALKLRKIDGFEIMEEQF
tara:strand:+ start:1233 stop:1358 length:126 start_codon:yes stop_codon:yes gene_type:complete